MLDIKAVRQDPDLEMELRTYEQMLALSDTEAQSEPSESFADEVMNRVAAISYQFTESLDLLSQRLSAANPGIEHPCTTGDQ